MKRKGLKVRLLSILVSVILGFNCAFIPSVQVQANPALWGIYELIIALAVSAGVSVSSYNISQDLSTNAEKELKSALIKQMPDWLKLYTTGAELTRTMVNDGTLQTELEALAVGETYDMDGIGIVKKDDASYALSMGADIVKGVAEQIDEWAESDANDVVMDVEVDYNSYVGSNADTVNYAFNDLITNYSHVVYDAVINMGYDASNCCVLSSAFTVDDVNYTIFFLVPHEMSFVSFFMQDGEYGSQYPDKSTAFTLIDTDILFNIFNGQIGAAEIRGYLRDNRHDLKYFVYNYASDSIVDLPEDSWYYKMFNDDYLYGNYYNWTMSMTPDVYGYDDTSNSHLWQYFKGYQLVAGKASSIYTMFPTVSAQYLRKALDTTVDLEDNEPITMDINPDLSAELEDAGTLTQYITYVTEQSIDLQALQDTIIEAEQNSAVTIVSGLTEQTDSLLKGLQGQTKSLLDGIGDTITDALKALFVPSDEVVADTLYSLTAKFEFMNDLKQIGVDIEDALFGITPSPYLKIYIMPITKSKYGDWGMGEYILIDISWYADFKELGDAIIGTFLWIFFLWRLFLKLPSILNGLGADTYFSLPSASSNQLGLPLHQTLLEDKSSKGARK